jgi:hypothetical protein
LNITHGNTNVKKNISLNLNPFTKFDDGEKNFTINVNNTPVIIVNPLARMNCMFFFFNTGPEMR